MNDENENQAEGSGEGQPSVASHTSYREAIVDRTGELMKTAFSVAEDLQRPQLTIVREPGTGIEALGIIKPGENGGTFVPIAESAFDAFRDAPKRRKGTAHMTRLESFIGHVNRFKDPDSALFANDCREAPALVAVLDYHDDGSADREYAAQPRFGEHRTAYRFPLSDEWKAWTGKNGVQMSMIEFAEFIEDRIVDVESIQVEDLNETMKKFVGSINGKLASPTKLMELSRGLTIYENSVVKDVRKLQSGEAQIAFESEHVDASGAPLDIPNLFVITLPVFANSTDLYRIAARLRYRKTSGGIVFWFDLWRTDLVFDSAFTEACEKAATETGLPLFIGAPE